jgi:hypothetical protein
MVMPFSRPERRTASLRSGATLFRDGGVAFRGAQILGRSRLSAIFAMAPA